MTCTICGKTWITPADMPEFGVCEGCLPTSQRENIAALLDKAARKAKP